MASSRREFLAVGAAAAASTLASPARAQWQPSPRYPDPSIKILDPGFAKYRVASAKVERLAKSLDAWHQMAKAAKLKPDSELTKGMTKEQLDQLRSLGYVK